MQFYFLRRICATSSANVMFLIMFTPTFHNSSNQRQLQSFKSRLRALTHSLRFPYPPSSENGANPSPLSISPVISPVVSLDGGLAFLQPFRHTPSSATSALPLSAKTVFYSSESSASSSSSSSSESSRDPFVSPNSNSNLDPSPSLYAALAMPSILQTNGIGAGPALGASLVTFLKVSTSSCRNL